LRHRDSWYTTSIITIMFAWLALALHHRNNYSNYESITIDFLLSLDFRSSHYTNVFVI